MFSVIIPAHNETAVIRRCLETLGDGLSAGEAEIIVVCNGCSDDTAAAARRVASRVPVRVIETEVASKTHALNLGDAAAVGFPRLYLDADVRLSGEAARALCARLGDGDSLAVSPKAVMDFTGASWFVRAYYRVWTSLRYVRDGIMGAGTYGLSREGRARFAHFPDVIADDGYIRLLFAQDERAQVPQAEAVVTAPAKLWDLIKIKTRSRLGHFQLRQRFPDLATRERHGKQYGAAASEILRRPTLWPAVPVYVLVVLLARVRATKQFRRLDRAAYRWERDDSSRPERGSEVAATQITA